MSVAKTVPIKLRPFVSQPSTYLQKNGGVGLEIAG